MPSWVFPVQLNLEESPANAAAAQEIGKKIEKALEHALMDQLDWDDACCVIAMQPIEGTHRLTVCNPEK